MHETWNLHQLADEIINGRRLTTEDDLQQLITCDLDTLCKEADRIRRCKNKLRRALGPRACISDMQFPFPVSA